MAEQMTMNDILGDADPLPKDKQAETPKEPAAPAEAKTETTAEPKIERSQSKRKQWEEKEQAAQGRLRDPDTGQYVTKEPAAPETAPEPAKAPETPAKPAVAAPQQDMTDKEKAFLRGMEEERKKRQELERRLAAIEASGRTQPAAPAGTAEAPKTFWDDPEGALAKHEARVGQVATNARLATAEFIARQKHTDFDEKIEKFGEILQQTPGLHAQWLAASDPAEFAYNIGKNHLELQQAGSIDALRTKIEAETRVKLEDELKVKAEALAKERAALPPSLSEARSTGTNKPVWSGPTSMNDILGG